MNTTDEYNQKLVELIERSAKIDELVVKSRQTAVGVMQELEELRAKQQETTNILHKFESSSSNAWENIGRGG
jgi:hypothetical protein